MVDELLKKNASCPCLLVMRGILILLLDHTHGPPLREAERCFLKAFELNPDSLETLEELAHYYDVVDEDRAKAKHYAKLYLVQARGVSQDMERILAEE